MRAKNTLTLLFPIAILLFVIFGMNFTPFSGKQNINMKTGWHISNMQQALASILPKLETSSSYAAEKRFDDYFNESEDDGKTHDKEGWTEPGVNGKTRYNIFLKTDKFSIKLVVFIALTVIFYLASWAIFRAVIMSLKSPAKTFAYSFLGFLLLVYASIFICFSEYAMIQAYDKDKLYIFQLNWMVVLVISAIWIIGSLLFTYLMKGKV